jgi:hypothetical protein
MRITFWALTATLALGVVSLAQGIRLSLTSGSPAVPQAETPIRAESPALPPLTPQGAAPRPTAPPENTKPPEAPPYVKGGGVLQIAIGPTAKGLRDCKSNLWSVLGSYQGDAWRPRMATVKWFGDKWTLVFDGVSPVSAEAMCPWLKQLGWNWRDGYCQRICVYRPSWPASKP